MKKVGKKLSLRPLEFERVIEDLLKVPPEPKKGSKTKQDKTEDSDTKQLDGL